MAKISMSKYDLIITGPMGNIGSRLLAKCTGANLGIHREEWSLIENTNIEAKAVIHCAFDLKHSYAHHPKMMIDSNILSTARLLEVVKKNNIKKFIFISSCAVYGHSSNTSEQTLCIPISINGQVKLINEHFIQEFCSAHGIKYHIFRVFNLFGGDDHFSVVSQLLKSIRGGTPFMLNNEGISQRDFIHVDDVCDILFETLQQDLDFTLMNLGTGHSTRIKELFDLAKGLRPQLNYLTKNHSEIEYSRADLSQFNAFFKKSFLNVCDLLENEIKKTT